MRYSRFYTNVPEERRKKKEEEEEEEEEDLEFALIDRRVATVKTLDFLRPSKEDLHKLAFFMSAFPNAQKDYNLGLPKSKQFQLAATHLALRLKSLIFLFCI